MFTSLYINGQYRPAGTGETFDVRNPCSNAVVGSCASASSEDCLAAADAAGEAFNSWEKSPLNARRDIFLKAADIVTSDKFKEKLLRVPVEETAAPPPVAFGQWAGAAP